MKHSRVVCVLSGGGAKTAAHVGALRALEEWGQVPAHFVATSMGAVMAAAFAAGLTYDELVVRITEVTRRDVARVAPASLIGPFATHLLQDAPLRRTIAALVPARRFDQLRVPLTVTATDVETGELQLFGAGGRSDVPLVDALYASCALPVFYPPARIDGRTYADGGLRAVLPLDPAAQFDPDLVFAVNVGPTFAGAPQNEDRLPGMVRAHDMSVRILMAQQIAEARSRWREGSTALILVEPAVAPGTFAVRSAAAHVEAGYRAAWRELAVWRSAEGAPS